MAICNGTGVLAIWHDVEPGAEAEFVAWHSREHMAERLSLPGFLRGCRYENVDGSPQVFNFYLTETPSTLTSADYLERLNNPTPWTQRVVPSLRNLTRAACRVAVSRVTGEGGVIATLRFVPKEDAHDEVLTWLNQTGANEIFEQAGIVAAHLWVADPSSSSIETVESRVHGGNRAAPMWTIAIEANDVPFAAETMHWLRESEEFSVGCQSPPDCSIFRLQHRLTSRDSQQP